MSSSSATAQETDMPEKTGSDMLGASTALIVADSLPMLGVLRDALGELGIGTIHHGRTAQEVLTLLMTESFDLIVIDDRSPLDGVKFLHTLRQGSEKLPKAVPVMIVTAHAKREHIIAARDAGANEIVLKPCSREQLRSRLEKTVRRSRDVAKSESECPV